MLTLRQRYAIRISLLVGLNKRQEVKRLIARAAKLTRLSRTFFDEVFIHLSLLYGFPTLVDGLEFVASVFPNRRRHSSSRRHIAFGREGMRVLRRIYGSQTNRLLANLKVLHPELPDWIVEDVYGRVFARPGLGLRERELLNVVALGVQGLHRQLFSHIRGSLRAGIHPNDVKKILQLVERAAHYQRGSLTGLMDKARNAVH
jgi:4-carboxymuconolactone decarboxylase